MRLFFILVMIAAGLSGVGCSSSIELQGQVYHMETADEQKVTLERFVPPGLTAKKYPVIICHGLMARRNYFKANGDKSIVAILNKAGYDVWLVDLRGRPSNGYNGWFAEGSKTHTLDDYVQHDVNAVLTAVTNATGIKKVNWIGHSMGGIIVYARVGSVGDDRIANLITLASPGILPPSEKTLMIATELIDASVFVPVIPIRLFAGFQADTRFPSPKYITQMVYDEKNVDADMERSLMQHGTNDVSKNVMRQMRSAVYSGYFTSMDRKTNYSKGIKNISVPIMVVASRTDGLADAVSTRYVYDTVASTDKTFMLASRSNGFSANYGHTDLLIGRNAHKEIIPKIKEWLDARN